MLEGSFSFVSELKTNQFTTFTESHPTPEVWRNSPLMQNCGDCILLLAGLSYCIYLLLWGYFCLSVDCTHYDLSLCLGLMNSSLGGASEGFLCSCVSSHVLLFFLFIILKFTLIQPFSIFIQNVWVYELLLLLLSLLIILNKSILKCTHCHNQYINIVHMACFTCFHSYCQ